MRGQWHIGQWIELQQDTSKPGFNDGVAIEEVPKLNVPSSWNARKNHSSWKRNALF
jgi:hypothetical protein